MIKCKTCGWQIGKSVAAVKFHIKRCQGAVIEIPVDEETRKAWMESQK